MKLLFLAIFTIFSYGFDFNYSSISADFNQSVTTQGGKQIFYSGKIYAKVPNLMVWKYEKPIKKTIWINFSKVEVYEPNLIQVTIYNSSSKDNFFNMLKTAKKLNKNTYLKYFDQKNIYFKVDKTKIKTIYYKDKIDNSVKIKFFNQKVDSNLSNSIFIPNYPDYVDKIYVK